MSEDPKDLHAINSSHPQISAQDAAIGEVEEAMRRLKICPRKVLEPLGHLRIEKARIKPLEDRAPKSGGKADVEAAQLVPTQSSNPLGSKDTEYVAVKKLRFDTDTGDDRVLAPFAHEVNLLNDLSHPNVVKIVGFVEDVEQSIAWMVFLWEKNGNLREFVRSTNWELPERVSLIGDFTRGLSYLHGRTPPICHGDLKSLNVLVNSKNQAVITDLGSARTMDSATAVAFRSARAAAVIKVQHQITSSSTVDSLKVEIAASGDFITVTGPAWTVRWAAPELLEGGLPGLTSDIWALGWICWEVVTGNFPFDEENDLAIVLRITRGDLPAVGDNSQLKQVKALCSLMGECWRLNANERPTAIRCQQVISFMDQVMPSSGKVSGSATTRSSALLCALGMIQLRNGVMSEAENYFRESFVVAKSVGDKQATATALNALGDMYQMQREYSKARELYILARDTYSQVGYQLGFANSVRCLGDVYQMESKYSKAEESYIRARNTYSQIQNKQGFANSVQGLGEVFRMRSEHSKAKELYIQARDTYSQIGDQLGFANSVRCLGDVYTMQSEYSKAEESYIEARDTYSQIGNRLGFAHSVHCLGHVYLMWNKYFNAEESYIQARDTYSQIGDRVGFANSVQGLGRAFSALGHYAEADKSYLEAQAVFRQIGAMQSLAKNLWFLGWLRRHQAQYGEAEDLVREASILYGKLGLKSNVVNCDNFLAWVRQRMTK